MTAAVRGQEHDVIGERRSGRPLFEKGRVAAVALILQDWLDASEGP